MTEAFDRPTGADLQQLGVRVPAVVSGRLDGLLAVVAGAGVRTSRRGLVAALLYSAFRTNAALGDLVRRYRTAPAFEARIDGVEDRWVQQPIRKPGPRQSAVASADREQSAPVGDRSGDWRVAQSPTVRIGLALPVELLAEMQEVVAGLREERATRTELVAAVILFAPENAAALAEIVGQLRRPKSTRRRARSLDRPPPNPVSAAGRGRSRRTPNRRGRR